MNIAANRFFGVRAINVVSDLSQLTVLSRQHNDANLITFGTNFITFPTALKNLQLFLSTVFLSLPRYQKRNQILDQLTIKKTKNSL